MCINAKMQGFLKMVQRKLFLQIAAHPSRGSLLRFIFTIFPSRIAAHPLLGCAAIVLQWDRNGALRHSVANLYCLRHFGVDHVIYSGHATDL